jgi:hypothetical protein
VAAAVVEVVAPVLAAAHAVVVEEDARIQRLLSIDRAEAVVAAGDLALTHPPHVRALGRALEGEEETVRAEAAALAPGSIGQEAVAAGSTAPAVEAV